jgi:predicted NBD/HSP70 family sugar kinase
VGSGVTAEAVTPDDLRRASTARVLRTLREEGPASRVELAGRTGLSKATVGVVVARLERLGLLGPAGEDEARAEPGTDGSATRGRPARPVALRPGACWGLGLEVNVDYVAVAVVDLAGVVATVQVRAVRAASTAEDRLTLLLDLLAEVLASPACPDRHGLLGAVVAIPGLVDAERHRVTWAPNLGAEGDEVGPRLAELLGPDATVHVDNDATCAAYGERWHGAAQGAAHALYLTGTVGIGAGIVADGRVLRGAVGNAGEVGHVPLGRPGAPCGCGRTGCWETAVGLGAMLAAVGAEESGTPVESAAAVAERARTVPSVRAGLQAVAEDLARGLAVLVSVVDPEVVVLGGYFGALTEHLLEPAAERLDGLLPSPAQRRPPLVAGRLGITAAAVGAAELAMEPVVAGQVGLPELTGLPPSRAAVTPA